MDKKEKKISLPGFEKIERDDFLKKKHKDLSKIEKDYGFLKTPATQNQSKSLSKRQEKINQKKAIREHVSKMHEDALKDALGLDNPREELCKSCYTVLSSDVFIYSKSPEIKLCRKCYQSLERCHNCGRPVMKRVKGMSVHYCGYCKASKSCSSCGKEISPKSGIRLEGVRGFYCSECALSDVSCYFCSSKLADGKNEIAPGVHICPSCLKTSLIKPDDCAEVLNEVHSFLSNKLKIKLLMKIKTGLTVLEDASESLYKLINGDDFIYTVFQSGTPRHIVEGLFAKIIGELYISGKLEVSLESEDVKGFGRFIMYNYYNSKGYAEEAYMIKKSEENKEALLKFFKLEAKLGFSKIISTLGKGIMPLCI
jgi:hypothetical protein